MNKTKNLPRLATVTEQLRWYLKHCGKSTSQLERELGIHNTVFSRLIRAERGMGLDTLDTVCKHLNLRLVRGSRPGRERR